MKIIQSKLLNREKKLIHGFTTKENGNLAFHIGACEVDTIHNHQKLSKLLQYDLAKLVHMRQIHSNNVKIVNKKDDFENPPICDALITDKKNITLMVMVADCTPILFYDQYKKVIAVAHVGRAGAFNNIIKNVLKSMQSNFNSQVENILISIGTSIKVCCYEVGEEIYKEAKSLQLEFSIESKGDSYYLDIMQIIKQQLKECGILKKNIEQIDLCSCCSETHFSYRREKNTGREAAIIMLL